MLVSKHHSREGEFVSRKLWLHKTQSIFLLCILFVLFFYSLAFDFISVVLLCIKWKRFKIPFSQFLYIALDLFFTVFFL